MTTLIICIIIYVLSVLKMRDFIQKLYYHKKGGLRDYQEELGNEELCLTFIPFINTIFAIGTLFHSPYEENFKPNKTKKLAEFIFKPRTYKNETGGTKGKDKKFLQKN